MRLHKCSVLHIEYMVWGSPRHSQVRSTKCTQIRRRCIVHSHSAKDWRGFNYHMGPAGCSAPDCYSCGAPLAQPSHWLARLPVKLVDETASLLLLQPMTRPSQCRATTPATPMQPALERNSAIAARTERSKQSVLSVTIMTNIRSVSSRKC